MPIWSVIDPPMVSDLLVAVTALEHHFHQRDHRLADSSCLEQFADPILKSALDLYHALSPEQLCQIREFLAALRPSDPLALVMVISAVRDQQRVSGVYYTPQPLAQYAVSEALDQWLVRVNGRWELPLEAVRVLEPSVGSGVFLRALLIEAHRRFGIDACLELTSHVTAIDLSPAAIVSAQLTVATTLLELGFDSKTTISPEWFCGNTLTAELHPIYESLPRWKGLSREHGWDPQTWQQKFQVRCRKQRFGMVIGNPPFKALTGKTAPWIRSLLHGQEEESGSAGKRSYYHVGTEKLGEKKTWLHDEYVKFLRLAHWQIERTGGGVIALVLNRGILDNVTFRGLRYQLLQSFDRVQAVDLGGDRRNQRHERDENLFDVETGIVLLIASLESKPKRKLVGDSMEPDKKIEYGKVTGSRQQKLAALEGKQFDRQAITTNPPAYRFYPSPTNGHDAEYNEFWRLDQIFRRSWSAPVTARDRFIIDRDRERLVSRLNEFCDPQIDDQSIRERYFHRTRSSRYPPGDTRGWKLSSARKRLAQVDWIQLIRLVQYRPFDYRWTLWSEVMIDWPRPELTVNLSRPGNFCLIARRQAPPGDYSFFWVTREIPLDGILRSDNRGNETCFPLLVSSDDQKGMMGPNFEEAFKVWLRKRWDCESLDDAVLFAMIVAIVHSQQYRIRYREQLPLQFPRIPIPTSLTLAHRLADEGRRLIDLQSDPTGLFLDSQANELQSPGAFRDKNKSRNKMSLAAANIDLGISNAAWEFKAGSHTILAKLSKQPISGTASENQADELQRDLLREVAKRIDLIRDTVVRIDKLCGNTKDWIIEFRAHSV